MMNPSQPSRSPRLPVSDRVEQAEAFDFRSIHPRLKFGTASDRYAGWIGQIYSTEHRASVSSRKRSLGGQQFEERTLPVATVAEYFDHFSVLELDFTFYRPLLELDDSLSSNYYVLEDYAAHAPAHAAFLLKVPQQFFARTLRRSRDGRTVYEPNPSYLNVAHYLRLFYEPAREILADRLAGLIFEQEYQRVRSSPDPEEHIAELDLFFSALPTDVQGHLEIRSAHLLVPLYFDWLESRGLGFTFSHWTWLPSIRDQWHLCGERFTARNKTAVLRLLSPRDVSYADAYAQAYPFNKAVPELAEAPRTRQMIDDTTALAYQAIEHEYTLQIICNNRAYGNSPLLAQAISNRFLDFADRKDA